VHALVADACTFARRAPCFRSVAEWVRLSLAAIDLEEHVGEGRSELTLRIVCVLALLTNDLGQNWMRGRRPRSPFPVFVV